MKYFKIFIIVLLPVFYIGCGDPDVDITNINYEPKIAVEAYLYAGESIHKIKIMRNYSLNEQIDFSKLYLTPAENNVQVSINGEPLQFDAQTKTYFNNNIVIEYGKTYSLTVSAVVDGKSLSAVSETTVPQEGFKILSEKNLGEFKYGISDVDIDFEPSKGSDIYVFSIVAENAAVNNFIFDNIYFSDIDTSDVIEDLDDYRFETGDVSDINSSLEKTYTYGIPPYSTWFYTTYRTIVYAGDKNFRNFLFTAPNVSEPDGNFHEPIQNFKGDAIGVFASAIRDTVYFSIVK